MRFAALLCAAVCVAQGEPRKALKDYPVQASHGQFDIGVEYTVRSYSGTGEGADGQMYIARGYLVLEVAIFPKQPFMLPDGAFELTVNKDKRPLAQTQAEAVAASVRQPEWSTSPQMEAAAGMGNAGVVLGGSPRVERFPGDPRAQSRLPKPPQAPTAEAQKMPVDPGQIAISSALPAGMIRVPVSGNIYFPYRGNPAKIKQLSLRLSVGAETLDLKVR